MRVIKFGACLLFTLAGPLGQIAYTQQAAPAAVEEPSHAQCSNDEIRYEGACLTPKQIANAEETRAFLSNTGNLHEAAVVNRLVVVGAPKIYDDLYLQQRLASLQAQLQNTRAIDQATLLSHIGVAQGADLRQTSAAISASGPSTPSVSTFSPAAGVPAFSYPPGYTPSSGDSAFPTGTATTTTPGTTTALASMTPTAPTPTTPSLAPPAISSLGQSSLDAYNESLQLSAEITNTSLLLQGALSDKLTRYGGAKTSVTIGFPITVRAPAVTDKDLSGAVAEVHVEICSGTQDDPPSIATLLPQERTYNVASLVEKNFLASASAITGGVMSIGGGFLWSHKRYYLVQQQETVALLEPNMHCNPGANSGFAWQIRPVLGKEFIRPGNSVNFVQIAIPDPRNPQGNLVWPTSPNGVTGAIGQACVSVVWRKPAVTGWFGHKNGQYFGDDIPGDRQCYAINEYRTSPSDDDLMISVTDVGSGMVTVRASTIDGAFLPGLTVRLGNSSISPIIASTHKAFEFTTSASSIVAAGRVSIVGRDGREGDAIRKPVPDTGLTMGVPSILPYSESLSRVSFSYTDPQQQPVPGNHSPGFLNAAIDPLVVVIGGRVFGLSDAPFFANSYDSVHKAWQIQLIVPTALIQVSPVIELRRLLWPDSLYRKSATIPPNTFSKAMPVISSASILSTHNGLTIGLLGTSLDQVRMVFPPCSSCTITSAGSTFLQVALPKTVAAKKSKSGKRHKAKEEAPIDPTDGLKQLVFCRKGKKPDGCDPNFPTLLVDVPKLDSSTPKPSLDKSDPLSLNTAQVRITGTLLDQIASIEYAKASLPFRLVAGKNPALVVDLPVAMRTVPGGYPLFVTFADKTATAYLVTIK